MTYNLKIGHYYYNFTKEETGYEKGLTQYHTVICGSLDINLGQLDINPILPTTASLRSTVKLYIQFTDESVLPDYYNNEEGTI